MSDNQVLLAGGLAALLGLPPVEARRIIIIITAKPSGKVTGSQSNNQVLLGRSCKTGGRCICCVCIL